MTTADTALLYVGIIAGIAIGGLVAMTPFSTPETPRRLWPLAALGIAAVIACVVLGLAR